MHKCYLFDTSLRDGSQSENVSYTLNDKLLITNLLDDFGIDYVEGGWPGSNPKDLEYFKSVKKQRCKHSIVTVFTSTKRAKIKIEKDQNITKTIESEADAVCIFGKSWDFHVKAALQISPAENLDLITDSISYLKKYFKEVIFDLEHFFDGYKNNPVYATKVLQSINQAGADFAVLCDTNGGTLPWEVSSIIDKLIKDKFLINKFGIHAHNDGELGVANSLEALRAGASMVQGTINGFGERCGNANLISIIANAQLKMGFKFSEKLSLKKLTRLSRDVAEIANLGEIYNQAFTGKSAFAHKAGVHVSALLRNFQTYEHIDPQIIGNSRRILVSDLSGYSNLKYKISEWNFDYKDLGEQDLKNVLKKIKNMENEGYAFEAADASLELFLAQEINKFPQFFTIHSYRVMDENINNDNNALSLATVKFRVLKDSDYELFSSEGEGPVDALALALKKGLSKYYPQLNDSKLVDYKVRILGSSGGTNARVRVLITSKYKTYFWTTVGVGYDIIAASFKALVDAVNYQLFKYQTKNTLIKNNKKISTPKSKI